MIPSIAAAPVGMRWRRMRFFVISSGSTVIASRMLMASAVIMVAGSMKLPHRRSSQAGLWPCCCRDIMDRPREPAAFFVRCVPWQPCIFLLAPLPWASRLVGAPPHGNCSSRVQSNLRGNRTSLWRASVGGTPYPILVGPDAQGFSPRPIPWTQGNPGTRQMMLNTRPWQEEGACLLPRTLA